MKNHKGQIKVTGKTIKEIRFDVDFGCLYLLFSHNEIARTKEHSSNVNLDFDINGELVGIEFVGVKRAAGNLKRIFVELARTYNKPELEKIPSELKEDLQFI